MIEFINSVMHYPFLQKAIAAAVLCSIGFGITGPFVVTKRLTFLAGGIAHAVLGGIGIAYFFQFNTTAGSIASALVFAVILALTRSGGQNEDTLVSTMWAAGMSVGIIFIYMTPGYSADLASFLFGNILMVEMSDLIIIALLDASVLLIVVFFYYHFIYISFDEDFMEIRGARTRVIYLLLLVIISVTVVVTIKIVGLILVIALVSLPSVIALLFIRNMRLVMLVSTALGIVLSVSGIAFAYMLNIPAGASIILLASALYFLSLGIVRLRGRS